MTDLERVIKDRLDKECEVRIVTCTRCYIGSHEWKHRQQLCGTCKYHDTLTHLIAEDVEGMVGEG